jgi:phosphoribosyl-ATP pyrophosphohydrolase
MILDEDKTTHKSLREAIEVARASADETANNCVDITVETGDETYTIQYLVRNGGVHNVSSLASEPARRDVQQAVDMVVVEMTTQNIAFDSTAESVEGVVAELGGLVDGLGGDLDHVDQIQTFRAAHPSFFENLKHLTWELVDGIGGEADE